jgi:hypothetical protein
MSNFMKIDYKKYRLRWWRWCIDNRENFAKVEYVLGVLGTLLILSAFAAMVYLSYMHPQFSSGPVDTGSYTPNYGGIVAASRR